MRKSRANKTVKPAKATIRCAIYTRKSSEEGLDQEYNSLDAQRDAAEAYIASQKADGWTAMPDRYDDGGFTGGNMERPALDRLLRAIGLLGAVVAWADGQIGTVALLAAVWAAAQACFIRAGVANEIKTVRNGD